jgi:hypothetical protein
MALTAAGLRYLKGYQTIAPAIGPKGHRVVLPPLDGRLNNARNASLE